MKTIVPKWRTEWLQLQVSHAGVVAVWSCHDGSPTYRGRARVVPVCVAPLNRYASRRGSNGAALGASGTGQPPTAAGHLGVWPDPAGAKSTSSRRVTEHIPYYRYVHDDPLRSCSHEAFAHAGSPGSVAPPRRGRAWPR